MSSSKPPIHPTREQLDELEALLERMLALPVNQLEGETSNLSLPTLAPIDMPPDWETGDSAVLSAQARDRGAAAPSEEVRPLAGGQLGKNGAAADEVNRGADSPRWSAPDDSQNVEAPATNLTIVTRPAVGERPWPLPAGARRIAWPLRPLVWSNRAFDRCAGRFGAAGRWLRGPRGRALVGWSGVALLVSATAWAWLEWMGWTW
jgi:hypothetical protein